MIQEQEANINLPPPFFNFLQLILIYEIRIIGYEISDSSIISSPFPNHRMQQYCGLSLLMCASPIDIDNVDSLLFTYYVFRGIPEQVSSTMRNYTIAVFSMRLTRMLPNTTRK
jgi:hypothetical protein